MPTLSDDEEDLHDIVAEYENRGSEEEQGNNQRDGGSGSENEESKESTVRRIDPSTSSKRHIVRNPLPKLNTERLKGPKGIHTIEKYFEGFKYHGKGYEKLDLDRIMKRLEHWGHRLFPKLDFDDFIDRLEKLGTKKDLQVFIKKYRQDMIETENDNMNQDLEDIEEDKDQDEPVDEFDLLIAEQIEKQKQLNQQSLTDASNDAFNKLLSQSNVKISQSAHTSSSTSNTSQLSDEVKERIERNRQLAIQRRLARLQSIQEEAKRNKLEEMENLPLETNVTQNVNNEEPKNNVEGKEVIHEP